MNRKQFIFLIGCVALILLGCSTEDSALMETHHQLRSSRSHAQQQSNAGATQISGVGFFDEAGECDLETYGADFALLLTGDLAGCLFAFVESFDCSPSGTYREEGRELFVGTYNGIYGTFETTYKFAAKYEGCSDEGFVGAEIFGRCQHPIQAGSGEGVFEGVTGRLDFKDNVETGELPYRGHLRY